MGDRIELEVDDPPSGSMTTEQVINQLKHALTRREEWRKIMKEQPAASREYARWAKLVEHWEVDLFRREHHQEKIPEKT